MSTKPPPSGPIAPHRTEPTPLFSVQAPPSPARAPGRRRTGRHEKSLNRTILQLELTSASAAAKVSLLRALACALDVAEDRQDVYATAAAAREYFAALDKMGLVGSVAAADQDELDGLDDGPSLEDDDAPADVGLSP
jgi:hypothetical protein